MAEFFFGGRGGGRGRGITGSFEIMDAFMVNSFVLNRARDGGGEDIMIFSGSG